MLEISEIDMLALQPSEVRDTGEYLGELSSRQSVSVVSQVPGYVRKIHVRPGDKVEAGAVLIELDERQESAALESAKAQQRSSSSGLSLAKQTLDSKILGQSLRNVLTRARAFRQRFADLSTR